MTTAGRSPPFPLPRAANIVHVRGVVGMLSQDRQRGVEHRRIATAVQPSSVRCRSFDGLRLEFGVPSWV